MDDDNVFFTPREVAEKLRLHRNTVVKLILTQKLGATIVGKQYRVSQNALNEYIERNTTQTV